MNQAWAIVVVISFFAYLAAVVLFLIQGFDRDGRWQGRRGLWWFIVAALAFLVWTQALLRA